MSAEGGVRPGAAGGGLRAGAGLASAHIAGMHLLLQLWKVPAHSLSGSVPTATPAASAFSTSSLIFKLAAAPSLFPSNLSPHCNRTNLLKTPFWPRNYIV